MSAYYNIAGLTGDLNIVNDGIVTNTQETVQNASHATLFDGHGVPDGGIDGHVLGAVLAGLGAARRSVSAARI